MAVGARVAFMAGFRYFSLRQTGVIPMLKNKENGRFYSV
jgi:hypothetical protein